MSNTVADVYAGCTDDPAPHGREAQVYGAMHAMITPRNEVLRFLSRKERRMVGAWSRNGAAPGQHRHDGTGWAWTCRSHECWQWNCALRELSCGPRPVRHGAQGVTPLVGVELSPESAQSRAGSVPLDPAYEHVLVLWVGGVRACGEDIGSGQAIHLGTDLDPLDLELSADVRVLLLGGPPSSQQRSVLGGG